MPNDYSLVRAQRLKPKISFGKIQRVDETAHELTPEEIQQEKRSQEIKERGGAYSDRIKVQPEFDAPPRKEPLPSDTDIQKIIGSRKTTT